MTNIADTISKRRKELGMTLEQVGSAVGVGRSTVHKWETGSIADMGVSHLDKLAKALSIDPTELFSPYEAEAEVEGDGRSTWWYVCGECHTAIDKRDRFCRECGRKIKWTLQN